MQTEATTELVWGFWLADENFIKFRQQEKKASQLNLFGGTELCQEKRTRKKKQNPELKRS